METVAKAALPMGHQIAKLVVSTLAGFAAGKLTERGYDAALKCYRLRKVA